MKSVRFPTRWESASALLALTGLLGCLQSEPKTSNENAVKEQTRQISAKMDKPYLLNEQGEVIPSIPPEFLAMMKEKLRQEAHLSAAATLEEMYDPVTGKLKDSNHLPEIQSQADHISAALSKGAAR
ncbi:MAG: hypothetical protein JF616_00575 [Fibrobacteres bacterium]|jgi:hypothetical protein|nr:hypothetical protein [Fibrobacterota bacterium]